MDSFPIFPILKAREAIVFTDIELAIDRYINAFSINYFLHTDIAKIFGHRKNSIHQQMKTRSREGKDIKNDRQ